MTTRIAHAIHAINSKQQPPPEATPPEAPPPETSLAAWTRTAAQREAIPAAALSRVRLDLVHASAVAHRTHEKLLWMRPTMARLETFEVAHFDALPDLALALFHTNARLLARSATNATLPALLEELTPVRLGLAASVGAMVHSGGLVTDVLGKVVGGNNYQDMIHDVTALTSVMREHWGVFEGKCPFTLAKVEHFAAQAFSMADSVALRERDDDAADPLVLDRDRAVTLLVTAYDQVRRAVTFLRWSEGDVMTLVPSLNPVGAHGTQTPAAPATPATPEASPAPATPATPATPAVPVKKSALEELLDASPQHAVPQNDPFTR